MLIFTFAQPLTQIVIKALMLHELVVLFLLGPPLVFLVVDHFGRLLLGLLRRLCRLEHAAVAIGSCCLLVDLCFCCLEYSSIAIRGRRFLRLLLLFFLDILVALHRLRFWQRCHLGVRIRYEELRTILEPGLGNSVGITRIQLLLIVLILA